IEFRISNRHMLYYMHETLWKPKATREAAPTCDRVVERRHEGVGSGQENWMFPQFCDSLAGAVSPERSGRIKIQACAWEAAQAGKASETIFSATSPERFNELWVSHGLMDHPTSSRSDPETIRYSLSPQSYMETLGWVGLELSEARKTVLGARRKSHRALEMVSVAAYKKKLKNLVPIWFSLMKADFYWFQCCPDLGT
ncbi:MAG: hypothetical protein QME64_10100, partial [bacterium]|nr:hypothetical protein [bacterium]